MWIILLKQTASDLIWIILSLGLKIHYVPQTQKNNNKKAKTKNEKKKKKKKPTSWLDLRCECLENLQVILAKRKERGGLASI